MADYNILKRLFSKIAPSVEKEALEDIARMSPKSVLQELEDTSPNLVRQSQLEESFAAPKSQVLDEQMGIGLPAKNAEESASILSNSKEPIFLNSEKINAAETALTPDKLARFKQLIAEHPYATASAAGLGAMGISNLATNKPVSEPVRTISSQQTPSVNEQEESEDVQPRSGKASIKTSVKSSDGVSPLDLTKSSQEQSDFNKKIQQLMESRDKQQLVAQLGKAAEIIGSGISHSKPVSQEAYDEIAKNADQPLKDFASKLEMRKFDPNSDISKSYKQFAKQIGVKVSDSSSAADLEKLTPLMEKYMQAKEAAAARRDMRAMAQQVRDDEKLNKRFSEANNKIASEISSSRSAFGKAANVHRSAEAIERMTDGIDPNNLDSRQITELARNLDAMLSSGQATISGMKKLIPETFSGNTMKIAEYISGLPKGARQGEFVQRMLETVRREKELAGDQIKRTQRKILAGYEDLQKKDPERFRRLLEIHELPQDIFTENALKKKQPSFDDLGFKPGK